MTMPKMYLLNGSTSVKQALYAQGWLWMPTIYQFWITDKDYNLTPDRLAARIEEYVPIDYTGPVHLDLEHKSHLAHITSTRYDLDGPRHLRSRQMFIDILELGRKMRPDCQWGNYGLPGAMKWSPDGWWSEQTSEQRQAYIDRTLSMTDLLDEMGVCMSRSYDSYPEDDPDNKAWMDRVQIEWMIATSNVVRAVQEQYDIGCIHTFNHRCSGKYIGVPLSRTEIWQYQVLPAIKSGFDVQWWGASGPEWYLYEDSNLTRRAKYMANVGQELVEAGVNPADEADVRRYFDRDAAALGTWLANKIKGYASGAVG